MGRYAPCECIFLLLRNSTGLEVLYIFQRMHMGEEGVQSHRNPTKVACARSQRVFNSHTGWGIISPDCSGTGLFTGEGAWEVDAKFFVKYRVSDGSLEFSGAGCWENMCIGAIVCWQTPLSAMHSGCSRRPSILPAEEYSCALLLIVGSPRSSSYRFYDMKSYRGCWRRFSVSRDETTG